MRVTNRMMMDNAVSNMNSAQELLHNLHQRIASEKKFSVSSDDPVNVSASLSLRSSLRSLLTYKDTVAQTNEWMTASEFGLQQMEDIANRAILLVNRGLNDTMSAEERATSLATEMKGLLQEAVDYGNSTHNNQYIFSGYAVHTKPFELNADGTVTYAGGNGDMTRTLSPGQTVVMNTLGEDAFMDFYNHLNQARVNLETNNTASLRDTLNELQSALDTLDEYRTSLGARMRQVQRAGDYLDKSQIETQSLLSQKEDINLAESISLLRNQETTYQAVLEVSQRAISALSLFDYLR